MNLKPTYQRFGDHGLLINWIATIDVSINEEVLRMETFLSKKFSDEILETVPTYHSLAVYLKEEVDVLDFLETIQQSPPTNSRRESRQKTIVTIPVCYEQELSPDINEVAKFHKIAVSEVVKLHVEPLYKVFFLGFLPGFPYLGGLSEKLHTARKKEPRKLVEKGSVGIGGSQTGIYTIDSPGGWNIIGRCPLDFFNPNENESCLLNPGYYMKFKSISLKKFYKTERQVAAGEYEIRKEVTHD